jgi:hypothetical protein
MKMNYYPNNKPYNTLTTVYKRKTLGKCEDFFSFRRWLIGKNKIKNIRGKPNNKPMIL